MTSFYGFTGNVSLYTSVFDGGLGLPTYLDPATVTPPAYGTAMSTLIIGPMPSSSPRGGLFFVTVGGCSGGCRSVGIAVSLGPDQPDFNVSCCFSTGDGNVMVSQGTTYTSWGWVRSLNGFVGSVTLSISLDLQAWFGPSTVTLSSGQRVDPDITIIVPSDAATGPHYGSITGSSESLTHTIPLTVSVDSPPPDYSVSVSPTSVVLMQGSSAAVTVTVTSLYGFAATVSCPNYWGNLHIQVSVPPGLAGSVSPSCLTLQSRGTNTTIVTVSVGGQTPPGNYSITVGASFQVTPSGWTTVRYATFAVTVKLRGDVSGDCAVNLDDLARVGVQFGKTSTDPGFDASADLNNDAAVNVDDMMMVGSNFGRIC